MQWRNTARLVALCTLSASSNAAIISLFVPEADGYALSADLLGTGAGGRTTWLLGPGVVSGTLTSPPFAFPTATLIEGPNDVRIIQDRPEVPGAVAHDNCAIVDGTAVCTLVVSAYGLVTTLGTNTEPVSPVAVQVASVPPGNTKSEGATATETIVETSATPSATPSSTGGAATNGTETAGTGGAAPSAEGSNGAEKVVGSAYYVPFVVALVSVIGSCVV